MRVRIAVLLPLLATASSGIAGSKDDTFVIADTPDKFLAVEATIHKEMDAGGRFEFIKPADKTAVNNDLESIFAMLQKSGSVAAMNIQEKTKLFNTQEHVNGLLTRSDSQRLVCAHNSPLGSHIPTTTCRTYGEIEKSRSASQRYYDTNIQDYYRNTPFEATDRGDVPHGH